MCTDVPSFDDAMRGWRVAQQLVQRGADTIFEAGGYTGTCGLAGASVLPGVRALVGVDVDRYYSPEACTLGSINTSLLITSATKRVDRATHLVASEQIVLERPFDLAQYFLQCPRSFVLVTCVLSPCALCAIAGGPFLTGQ